jgi:hypothetical protein
MYGRGMASVRATMNCLGIDTSGSVSILGDFFGFSRRAVPPDPTTPTTQVSLLTLVRGAKQKHIHLNVIKVGFDVLPDGADGLDAAFQTIDFAILRMRSIYAAVNLGVGRVLHFSIASAAANGHDDIASEDEADDLICEFSVPNDGVDLFIVRNINTGDATTDFVGKASATPGDCDKESKTDGVVAGEINRTGDDFARTFAHETGHHLGLSHNHGSRPDCPGTTNGCNNLMAQTRCANKCGGGVRTAVLLTSAQGSTMRSHCAVRAAC